MGENMEENMDCCNEPTAAGSWKPDLWEKARKMAFQTASKLCELIERKAEKTETAEEMTALAAVCEATASILRMF